MSSESGSNACRDFIIIGGGAFGLSSAWHLLKDRSHHVTLYDHFDHIAPSRDVSKIVRIDYPDVQRMRNAIRSKYSWTSQDVFRSFFHHTGRIAAYSPASINTLNGIDGTRSELNLPARDRQTNQLLKSWFASEDLKRDLVVVENDDDGLVDWTGAMKSLKQVCVDLGVKFRDEQVLRMDTNGNGKVQGIVTSTESINTWNSEIILAAGPWIMSMLEASFIEQPRPSRCPIATGIFSFTLDLNVDQWEKYRKLPVFSEIGIAEFLCHPTKVGSAKVTWITPFLSLSGLKAISSPWDASTSNLALKSMLDARSWIRQVIPGLKGARIIATHSWWDGVTEDQNPIIARHPQYQNLLLAGGGSYTYAKDLPEIGAAVVDALDGKEEATFGWDRQAAKEGKHNQPALRARSNFEELERAASLNREVRQLMEKRLSEWVI